MILVTGGAGYIGSHTCVELLNKGYDIVVVDDLSNSNAKALERVKLLTGREFPFYGMDVCDQTALDKVCKVHKPTCVIHFAAFKSVPESIAVPTKYYENNDVYHRNFESNGAARHKANCIFVIGNGIRRFQ